jgi:tetratricopeptide (TPR) repeat protein
MEALSVFRGGFTWQAAYQVAGASLRELMTLANRSLLHRAPSASTEPRTERRYELHELLRRYAAEKLGQTPDAGKEIRDGHCARYVAALQHWERDLKSARQPSALEEMDSESGNVRAAWDWAARQGYVDHLDRAMDSLGWYCSYRRRYQEGEAAFREAAARLTSAVSAEGLRVLTRILSWQGRFSSDELDRELQQQSLALLQRPELEGMDTRADEALVLLRMGYVSADRAQAKDLYERSLALYQDIGDQWAKARVLSALGSVARSSGHVEEADDCSRTRCRSLGRLVTPGGAERHSATWHSRRSFTVRAKTLSDSRESALTPAARPGTGVSMPRASGVWVG